MKLINEIDKMKLIEINWYKWIGENKLILMNWYEKLILRGILVYKGI